MIAHSIEWLAVWDRCRQTRQTAYPRRRYHYRHREERHAGYDSGAAGTGCDHRSRPGLESCRSSPARRDNRSARVAPGLCSRLPAKRRAYPASPPTGSVRQRRRCKQWRDGRNALRRYFGWEGGQMASLYTRAADRRALAAEHMSKLSKPRTSIPAPHGEGAGGKLRKRVAISLPRENSVGGGRRTRTF